jgi:hypothetical protein
LLSAWYRDLARAAPDPGDQPGGGFRCQNALVEDPRSVRQWMIRFNLTSLDGEAECSRADAERVSGFCQIHESLCLAATTIVTRDLMMGAQGRHSFSRPAIAAPGYQTVPVKGDGQHIIRTDPRQRAHGSDDVFRGVCATLTPPSSRQSQLGMRPAFPMNDEDDFTGVRIDIDDDFLDQGSDQAFLQPNISVRTFPDGIKVRRQIFKFLSGRDEDLRLILEVLVDPSFNFTDTLQRLIPASLQLVGH